LQDFLKIIKEGPPLAKVTDVEQSNVDKKEGESSFEQKRGGYWG
jgi:acylphosphatase